MEPVQVLPLQALHVQVQPLQAMHVQVQPRQANHTEVQPRQHKAVKVQPREVRTVVVQSRQIKAMQLFREQLYFVYHYHFELYLAKIQPTQSRSLRVLLDTASWTHLEQLWSLLAELHWNLITKLLIFIKMQRTHIRQNAKNPSSTSSATLVWNRCIFDRKVRWWPRKLRRCVRSIFNSAKNTLSTELDVLFNCSTFSTWAVGSIT